MPDLPDVEGFRHVLASCAQGRHISDVEVGDSRVLHGLSPHQFQRQLKGRRFTEPERRGKWLLAHTDGPTVLLHFGMTGRLLCCAEQEPHHPHDRVIFVLDQDHLRYRDQRMLQGLWLAADDSATARILEEQGPDALAVDRTTLDELLIGRRSGVKQALMDQTVLAGLGNLLSDEILWRAHVHPARRACELTAEERRRLHTELRRALRASVRAGHIPAGPTWLTGCRDTPDPTCPRCGTALRTAHTAGRRSVWCPRCQPTPA